MRASQHRGNVKSLACELVPSAYGFVDPADGDPAKYTMIIQENRDRVETLKTKKSFVYLVRVPRMAYPSALMDVRMPMSQNPKDRTVYDSMYRNRIISKIVNTIWFNGMNSDGIKYATYFSPFPLATLVFVVTAVCCSLDTFNHTDSE